MVAAGAIGASLVMTLGACSSSGGSHNESTAQVCSDLQTQFNQMEGSILAAIGTTDPTTASADQQAQMLTAIKAALTTAANAMKTASGNASDSGFSKALSDASGEITGELGKLNSINDLNSLSS